jgi:parvulin-like peptidyl-prolyl isomerase
VMQEVFFRLKDREESWESLAQQFSRGDTSATGRVGPVPVGTVEEPLLTALRQQGPGRVCRPISLGEQVVVAELEAFQPSEFNEELRTRILRDEFERWLQEECSKMLTKVTYSA